MPFIALKVKSAIGEGQSSNTESWTPQTSLKRNDDMLLVR